MVEKLGNKSIFEKCINIRTSNFRFGDKMKYYNDYPTSKGDGKKATYVEELKQLSKTNTDFTEADIKERTNTILEAFGMFQSSKV
ncbi:MAG: hypothetical protein MJY52_03265 [Bacteroidaceae bacterium]|nr:hypothetical protein [Bacteroidaceae bacterium]